MKPRPSINEEWTYVTPQMAEELLSENRVNRPLSERHIARYVHDMKRGHWFAEACPPILLSSERVLIDGQHRLWAIVKSGEAQWLLIRRGVPGPAIHALDKGKGRSLGDSLKILGVPQAAAAATAAKATLDFQITGGGLWPNYRQLSDLSTYDYLEWHDKYADQINATVRATARLNGFMSLRRKGCYLVSFAAIISGMEASLDSFIESVTKGRGHEESAATVLHNWWIRECSKPSKDRASDPPAAHYIIWAWNRWITGEPVQRVSAPHGGVRPALRYSIKGPSGETIFPTL